MIRELTQADSAQMVSIINSIYDRKHNTEYIDWRCFNSTEKTKVIGYFDKDLLLGFLGLHIRALSNKLSAGQISWINIRLGFQGQGIFKTLAKESENYFDLFDFICVFANKNAMVPCQKYFNMECLFEINNYFTEAVENDIKDCPPFTAIPINDKTLLMDYHTTTGQITFLKSREYRKWRYADNPVYNYIKIELDNRDYSIVKLFHDKKSGQIIGDIVDFDVVNYTENNITRLYLAACDHLKQIGAHKISSWFLPYKSFNEAANKLGFTKSYFDHYFLFTPLTSKGKDIINLEKWHLVQSDSTLY